MKLRGFTYYSLNTNRKAAGGNSTASSSPPRVFRPRADVFGLFRTGALAPDTRVAVSSLGKQMAILHDFTDDTALLRARISKIGTELPMQSASDIDQMA